jgi:tRNA(adenine34) deaminase
VTAAWADEDVLCMQAALAEAELAADINEIPVGAVVVTGGEIIARGHNRSITEHDPAGHTEIVALRVETQKAAILSVAVVDWCCYGGTRMQSYCES